MQVQGDAPKVTGPDAGLQALRGASSHTAQRAGHGPWASQLHHPPTSMGSWQGGLWSTVI